MHVRAGLDCFALTQARGLPSNGRDTLQPSAVTHSARVQGALQIGELLKGGGGAIQIYFYVEYVTKLLL